MHLQSIILMEVSVVLQVLCVDDEYPLEGQIYSLDYRTIEGDVSLPHNSFKTQDFIPNGM